MDVNVRRATEEDATQLYGLMKQYIVDFYAKAEPEAQEVKAHIRYLLANPATGLQFVAEENGRLLGFATLYFSFSTLQLKRQAIMNDLFVTAEARGKKVGEKLFQACVSYTRVNDLAYMSWETGRDNVRAQAFYDKMGGLISDQVYYEID
ncbi:GNAT family N-acetyltransferase [Planococcus lenghuensis]|uniref:GNAT family N-acetyltransferase n=1 Tax=Planococcus lenghuensis TaxID=2213202 RepID=A0A1Q2KWJ6_9BACL|nr:GNAT family N-acetyltransferase [Planococcus lenghuensis]AQQ52588.1 GNAT family N-acetyltransferase [Planococcus lenghuensis]